MLVVTIDGEETEYTADVDLKELKETATLEVKSGRWTATTHEGKYLGLIFKKKTKIVSTRIC